MTTTGDRREHVLDYIVAHGGATVAQLSAQLGLSDATVRRHLDQLAAAGLLHDRLVHQATGRPYRLYSATNNGVRDRPGIGSRRAGRSKHANRQIVGLSEA